ncbi:receptor lectin kinase [Rhynchospora pubera]|uniref:Receptor lectin kinase n=1 Tax=Rhynchospora pubera TaxID=906938 RepID=A0AAV8EKP5_9POAL|nr:receptor lectin kinase [Rhynchospora pubera]
MAISIISEGFQALLLSFCLFLLASPGCSISFNFDFTKNDYSNITCTGDASPLNDSHCKDLVKSGLTKDSASGMTYSTGKAFYNQPVPLWDNNTGEVTNFNTTFSFKIHNTTNRSADGLAFFLSPYPPHLFNGAAGTLGLFNITANGTTIAVDPTQHMVAIEFDTFFNYQWDPPSLNNFTDCHIGIDINNLSSTVYEVIPNSLLVDNNMTAHITYNNLTQTLTLQLSQNDNPAINFNINTMVDLKSILPKEVVIGFSATTGKLFELHLLYSWSFNSSLDVVNPSTNRKRTLSNGIIGAIIASVVILLLLGTFLYLIGKKHLINKNREIEMVFTKSMDDEFEKGRGPKRFQYNELATATMNFAEAEKLGEGGFGSVYRGFLGDDGIHVAIKRVSKGSKQGQKEYISEVKIISQLRHRNLVPLIGWCHDHGELLLVYELMHNGSLDIHLYHKERVLAWPVRHKIALGLGFALLYLHEGCEQCVVHRDIKPSNVMLDSLFNAKLGDFGLARLIDHQAGAQTTIPAGTMGYIAPECIISGKASSESDVYSFGVVLLEIASGRKPVVLQEDESKPPLVEWVWSLYGSGSILDAMDLRLNGEFEAQEAGRLMVIGLWCAQPNHILRPSIRQAINALTLEAPLPNLPPRMPMPTYASSFDGSEFPLYASFWRSSGAAS